MLRSELETFIYRVSDAFRIPTRLAYEEIRAFAEYEFNGLTNGNKNVLSLLQ